jgi:hypothetical protein
MGDTDHTTSPPAQTGTAKTGTARTGTAKTGTARTGTGSAAVSWWRSIPSGVRGLPLSVWIRMLPYSTVAALAIGVPSDVINTPIFGRPVPVRTVDYLILAATSALIGLVFAIRRQPPADDATGGLPRIDDDQTAEAEQNRAVWGGLVSFLSVGCPVCNQAVVALVGTSGALSWWAPVQPLIGVAAIGLLVVALGKRLATYQLTACPLPTAS